jgi:RimJ/RimL family protein N-acetyltransferase
MIGTRRLVLRGWRHDDLGPWAAMNADPAVREHLGPLLTRDEAAASMRLFQQDLDRKGYGFWAVEVRDTGEFVGFTGLDDVDDDVPFTGVEIGWRLARPAWGHGYATEAARAVLDHGFGTIGLDEILAIATATNIRSHAVMARLGMTRVEEFDGQVVYRIRRT